MRSATASTRCAPAMPRAWCSTSEAMRERGRHRRLPVRRGALRGAGAAARHPDLPLRRMPPLARQRGGQHRGRPRRSGPDRAARAALDRQPRRATRTHAVASVASAAPACSGTRLGATTSRSRPGRWTARLGCASPATGSPPRRATGTSCPTMACRITSARPRPRAATRVVKWFDDTWNSRDTRALRRRPFNARAAGPAADRGAAADAGRCGAAADDRAAARARLR